jgi:FtsH-binding integral membrane protein
MIPKSLKRMSVQAFVWIVLLVPAAASAQFTERIQQGLNTAGQPAGLTGGPTLEVMIGRIIGIVLGATGVILLGLLIYAGVLWMTAGGDKEKVTKARGMIFNAIIGLVITILAFAISEFVINRIIEIQSGTTDAGGVSPT